MVKMVFVRMTLRPSDELRDVLVIASGILR